MFTSYEGNIFLSLVANIYLRVHKSVLGPIIFVDSDSFSEVFSSFKRRIKDIFCLKFIYTLCSPTFNADGFSPLELAKRIHISCISLLLYVFCSSFYDINHHFFIRLRITEFLIFYTNESWIQLSLPKVKQRSSIKSWEIGILKYSCKQKKLK